MVFADVIDQGLDGIVVFLTDGTLVTDFGVNGQVLYQMGLVRRLEATDGTCVKLTCVDSHMCVEIS